MAYFFGNKVLNFQMLHTFYLYKEQKWYKIISGLLEPLQSVPPQSVPSTIRPPTKRPGTIRPRYKASPPQSVPATKRPHHKASPLQSVPCYKASPEQSVPIWKKYWCKKKSENYGIQLFNMKKKFNMKIREKKFQNPPSVLLFLPDGNKVTQGFERV